MLFCGSATPEELSDASGLTYVAFLFLAACLGTITLLAIREKVFTKLEQLGRVMPGHLSTYTLTRIRRFIVGLEPLLKPSRVALLSVMSLAVWAVELLAYYFVTLAFGQEMSIGGLALFLAAVNFSSLIPAGPGGVGVIEVVATLILVRIGIQRESAFSMVVVQHAIQYFVVGVPGVLLFVFANGRAHTGSRERS